MAVVRPAASFLAKAPGKFASLPDGVTHYRIYGAENAKKGKPLIACIHGINGESPIWEPFALHMVAQGRTVLTFDLYGRGYSDASNKNNDLDLFVNQTNALINSNDVKQVIPTDQIDLLGVSLGGGISAGFAAKHPARVRKLALLAPAGLNLPAAYAALAPLARLKRLGAAIVKQATQDIEQGMKNSFGDPAHPDVVAYLPKAHARVDEINASNPGYLPSFVSTVGWFPLGSMGPHYKLLEKREKFLAIWGDKDKVVPFDPNGAKIKEHCPTKADVHVIAGSGHIDHFVIKDKIDALHALVTPYINS